MKGPQHLGLGLVSAGAGLWAARLLGADIGVLAVCAGAVLAGVGALAPDIDHPRSLISRGIPGRAIDAALRMALALVATAGAAWYLAGSRAGGGLLSALSPILRWALVVVAGALLLGLGSLVASKTLGHRGPIHSVAAGVLASTAVALGCVSTGVPAWYGLAFGWGWLTHLLADMTTREGLPSALWPLAGRGSLVSLLVGTRSRVLAALMLKGLAWTLLAVLVLGAGRWLLSVASAAK